MPPELDMNAFDVFVDYVLTRRLPPYLKIDIARHLLRIATELRIASLEQHCIDTYLADYITRDNVLSVLQDTFTRMNTQAPDASPDEDLEEFWYDFFNKLLNHAAHYSNYLIKIRSAEFARLQPSIVEEIVERALAQHRADP